MEDARAIKHMVEMSNSRFYGGHAEGFLSVQKRGVCMSMTLVGKKKKEGRRLEVVFSINLRISLIPYS